MPNWVPSLVLNENKSDSSAKSLNAVVSKRGRHDSGIDAVDEPPGLQSTASLESKVHAVSTEIII